MLIINRSIAGSLVLCVAAVGFTGCRTMDEHRTATGAVAGTVVGTTAGALIDRNNPWRGALIGAAAGAAVGGGIGYVLQQQKDAFDRISDLEARPQRVVVQQYPQSYYAEPGVSGQPEYTSPPPQPQEVQVDALLVTISSEVLFPVGSSALSAHGTTKVREVAAVLNQYPDSDVYIRGYTSSEGDDRANFELSQRRAQVVRNELIAAGVAPNRLWAEGMGSSNPVASNATEAGRVQNRRVELHVVPRSTQ
jgi:outer membrane protein OmpA-like peptidoglycan-associated protein